MTALKRQGPWLSVVALASVLMAAMTARAAAQCVDDHDCTMYFKSAVADEQVYVKGDLFVGPNDETWISDDRIDTFNGYFVNMFASYKAFRIDHPVDPANKFLFHWSVESPEMKNIYDGVVSLDKDGRATVTMPEWFDSLNGTFRYQLTPVGGPGQGLYIASEIAERQFEIAGGPPGLKVSWQVTGVRRDPGALRHGTQVEVDKTGADRGQYIDALAYGKPTADQLKPQGRPSASVPGDGCSLHGTADASQAALGFFGAVLLLGGVLARKRLRT